MKRIAAVVFLTCVASLPSYAGDYLGQLSINPYAPDSISSPGRQNFQIKQSMSNEYSSGGPKLYDSDHNFRGNLNGNRYDSDSISNPYGRYGSRYSSESIKNPYGAGSRYRSDSPNNPHGTGLSIFDE